jgi:hypothetical protein
MERSMRAEDDPRVLVELDTTRPDSDDALDMAVRAAASLCLHLARRGGCLVCLPDDPRPTVLGPDLQSWPAVHARLALLGPRTTARRAAPARRGLSLIRISARSDRAGEPAAPHCRIAPHPLPGAPTLFELAGCSAQCLDGRAGRWAA